ncbi:MAG: cobaltochelatase subunit CobN [Syntrophobacterales bacterium]|nr:cobaltochelatase subunit CobN [Syntrophobacterales bacterium]
MKPLKLCYFSATSTDVPSLSEGVRRFKAEGGKIHILARTQGQLLTQREKESFVQAALNSDVVIITFHGGTSSFPAFDLFIKAIDEVREKKKSLPYLHLQSVGGMDEEALEASRVFSTEFGSLTWDRINLYINYGGSKNIQELLKFLTNRLFESNIPYSLPIRPPEEGIYHPHFPEVLSLKDYLEILKGRFVSPPEFTIGLWFYQSYWLNGNLEFIDAIIGSIEAHGAAVIPVFHLRYKDKERGNKGASEVANMFFMDGDRSRIDALINPLLFSLTLASPDYADILPRLNVPCIQAITSMSPFSFWKNSYKGLSVMDVAYSVAQPEFDGAIIAVPVATREEETIDPITGASIVKLKPIAERVDKVVRLALNWARLRKTPPKDRKIAIVFHNYPPRVDRIGCAAGLDSFSSVKHLLDYMKDRGYKIEQTYKDGTELAHEMISKMTCDRRWLPMEEMAKRAKTFCDQDEVKKWFSEVPQTVREKMKTDWGDPPGPLFVHQDKMFFPGLINGNVLITLQPPRGFLEQTEKIYHDPHLSPPYNYLAQYRWIRDVFKAHAIVHVGKHGSLEWLPGKAVGLSEKCYPDLAIMELPNIYPYIINDPGEGTQAKRRSYACIINHLTPAMTNADLYDDLAKIQELIADYQLAKAEDPTKEDIIKSMIWEAVEKAHLDKDLSLTKDEALENFEVFLEKVHAYLGELGDTMINDGLHTMGLLPEGERLAEFIVQLTRLPNGDVPSLREAIISWLGFDYDDVMNHLGQRMERFGGKTGSDIIRLAHEKALDLVRSLQEKDFSVDTISEVLTKALGGRSPEIESVLLYICETLMGKLQECRKEIDWSLHAFNGGFVPPGPSGAPTRGQANILPTGKNFYSVDPNKIPTPAAWEVGVRLGDALLERYLKEKGSFPESVALLLFATSTMRTRGDDVAEIFYLMGLKPIWQKGSGNVIGLEIIPLEELKRPRIDVVPRISGLFRDTFPNLVQRIDEAVQMVATLKETPDSNFILKHVESDLVEYMVQGMSREEAFREATLRVFGCPPGTYGAGVAELIESKNWKNQEELGNIYIRYSSHAYGREVYGKEKPQTLRKILSRVDATVKNEDSREYDMMSCTDYYNYYGGLIVAVKTVRGFLPFATMGDSADPKRVKIRTTEEEAKHVLRSRLINPKWIEGMKQHGFKGAGDISHVVDIVFGWDATAEVMEDWMYEEIAKSYALNPNMREWMKKVNPYALHNILDKLLEAIARGMWKAAEEMEEELRHLLLEMEGEIEEWTDME